MFELPGYLVIERLSENNTFTLYRARRRQDDAPVLLKVLNQSNPKPKLLAGLWQEYEILRRLDLPGVDKAYALENHPPWWMMVLEDFGGQQLNQLNLAGRLPPEELMTLALQLAGILESLHTRQVIHKNISPSNISYNPATCQARLTNFGYASLLSKERVPLQNPYRLAEFLTYISPEMTGRMNRSVDYRSDSYSLGVVLYELLTGTPPFSGESPLELVHAHLAILPDPPSYRIEAWRASPAVFQMLSAIILKLLAKSPEDRYQTPAALQSDLRQCLAALQEPSKAGLDKQAFVPGQTDRAVELNISQIVFGRARESEALLQAFLRTIDGPAELMLVSGEAGVGKTMLVNQLIRPVSERNGLFLYAKFDQTRHLEVYEALSQLLDEFCRFILSEPTASFKDWRERIQAAVAPHGHLLVELCPALEKVIGSQPLVEADGETLARLRLHQVVIHFLQVVCRPDHPVVVFIDDIQWINPDSLLLWQAVLSSQALQNLLVVGAYREDQADLVGPVQELVDEVRAAPRPVVQLQLHNLEWSMVNRLVAVHLASTPEEISELTTLIYQKTQGNPYYSNEFLKSLNRDQLLTFDSDQQKWRWDADRIDEYGISGNVVDFFVHEIACLEEATQKMLQVAALLGRRFDAVNLLAILGQDKASLLSYSLWQAMTEGLIHPLDENYRFLVSESLEGDRPERGQVFASLTDPFQGEVLFEFQHDRVQQAAIAMLDEQQLGESSLQIGWLLLEKFERVGQASVPETLFDIVDHLNTGSRLIADSTEAVKIAQLNLMAGQQARAVAAFEAASRYLSAGILLLPADCWENQYTLALDLHTAGAEVALLNGDLARAEALTLTAESTARTLMEKARIIKILMDLYLLRTELDRVVEIGIDAIKMFGFDLQAKDPPVLVGEQAIHLPSMTDPQALAISRLIDPLTSAAFARNDALFDQIILFFMDLFSKFGNPPGASFVYGAYGLALSSQFEQLDQGCRIGKLALELAEMEESNKSRYAVRFVYYAFIHHWLESAREGVEPLYENVDLAFNSEDLRFSINSWDSATLNSLFVGITLEQVRVKQQEALQRLELLNQVKYTQRLRIWSQVVLNLVGETHHPQVINGVLFDQDEAKKLIEVGSNQTYLFNLLTAQSFLSLIFREQQQALDSSVSAYALRRSVRSQLIYPHYIFFYSLALLSAGLDAGDLSERLEKVEENLRLMRLWAGRVPVNFLHQLELVEAELARCLGQDRQAADGYERAIQATRRNGYIHESALAAELAAEFYLSRGEPAAARDHLYSAYYAYQEWGAKAKVTDLIHRYPEWLPPDSDHGQPQSLEAAWEVGAVDELAASIDLTTILKASLELAQETNLEMLLRKLMLILIENAGAQNGSLVLWREDRWFLEIQGSSGAEKDFSLCALPLEEQAAQTRRCPIPASIIHYVINSQESLVLNDVSASLQFSQDPYVQARKPKSVLCAPLLNQGVLSGVIYLENNLLAGAFTADRLEVVRLISGQAAVLIEKARLYATLEARVDERTRQLSAANIKLQEEIDERIRVEEALHYNEALLRKVFEILPVGIWIVDKDSRIVSANPEAQRIWSGAKYVHSSEYGEYKAWHRDTGKRVRAEEWAAALAIHKGQTILDEELDIQTFDGRRRIIYNSAIPLETEEEGLMGAIVVNQDITQRKHDEEDLQRAHDQLSTLLNISQLVISTLDLDPLLNVICDQLGKVMPYDAAGILIYEENTLKFRILRGPAILQRLKNYTIPLDEQALLKPLVELKQPFYLPDLQANDVLLLQIQNVLKIPIAQFSFLRSWLGLPLISQDALVGGLILGHSKPHFYSPQSRAFSQAYANQVAIAIHNAQLYQRAQSMATLEERNRLARELHDSVAQALYSIGLFTDATRKALKANKLEVVNHHLEELVDLSREAMSDMRMMIFELRPPVIIKDGLAAALQTRLDSVETRAGIQASLDVQGDLQLSPEQEGELYRIAQEALNNVIKHSRAGWVKVGLSRETGGCRMTIEDNGMGFDPATTAQTGGQGIRSIHERAENIGAACTIESSPNQGTKITIEVEA